jgi:hypothetical protein
MSVVFLNKTGDYAASTAPGATGAAAGAIAVWFPVASSFSTSSSDTGRVSSTMPLRRARKLELIATVVQNHQLHHLLECHKDLSKLQMAIL